MVLVAWTKYVAKVKPWKLAQLAVRVFRVDPYNYSEEQQAEILSGKLKDYFASLHLKTTLTELGIGEEYFGEMAERATRTGGALCTTECRTFPGSFEACDISLFYLSS